MSTWAQNMQHTVWKIAAEFIKHTHILPSYTVLFSLVLIRLSKFEMFLQKWKIIYGNTCSFIFEMTWLTGLDVIILSEMIIYYINEYILHWMLELFSEQSKSMSIYASSHCIIKPYYINLANIFVMNIIIQFLHFALVIRGFQVIIVN